MFVPVSTLPTSPAENGAAVETTVVEPDVVNTASGVATVRELDAVMAVAATTGEAVALFSVAIPVALTLAIVVVLSGMIVPELSFMPTSVAENVHVLVAVAGP